MTVKCLWKPLKWNRSHAPNSLLTFEGESQRITWRSRLSDFPKKQEFVKLWKRVRASWPCKTPDKNDCSSEIWKVKWKTAQSQMWKSTFFALTSDFIWRMCLCMSMEVGVCGEGEGLNIKEIWKCRAFNSNLCVNSPGILLDLMKASKVTESLK